MRATRDAAQIDRLEPPRTLEQPPLRSSPRSWRRRALLWDSWNTSSFLVAHSLIRRGWVMDALIHPESPWRGEPVFNGERYWVSNEAEVEEILFSHPLDALFLHGDDQVRWLLSRWADLPAAVRRHLSPRESLEIALSKNRSMLLARDLGIPVLATRQCHSPAEVRQAADELANGGEVVVKGEGGSAGSAVRALRRGALLQETDWRALTRGSPWVMVQKRIRGPRLFMTVVYEHGTERAACGHEKLLAWPHAFGVTALGVTRKVDPAHDYTHRLFEALRWHGLANVEFRQDLDDGRWYFMEINPRVNCSLGIQEEAGMDVAAIWAEVGLGRGAHVGPSRQYRDQVRYWWAVPAFALLLRKPWLARHLLRRGASDWKALEGASRFRLLRTAFRSSRKR